MIRFSFLAVLFSFVTTFAFAAPNAPTGLNSSSVTVTSFTLKWTAATGGSGTKSYLIFRNGTQIGTATTTSFNATGLTPATTYSMTVKAKDTSGTSAASSALSVKTLADTTKPSTPTNLASSAMTATTFTLTWTSSTDNVAVTGYNIYKAGVLTGTSTTPTFAVTGLAPNTTYSMTVVAKDAAGNLSAASIAKSVKTTTDTTAPAAPTNPASSTITATSFTLTWTASTDNVGVTGYTIFNGATQLGTATTTTYNATGLTAATTYNLTVRAKDAAANTSAASSALSVKTAATTNQPPIITLTAPAANATFTLPSTVTLTATASDPDGTIAKVEFFNNGTSLGSKTTSPYSLSWTPAVPGFAALTAVATDNLGATSTSASVSTGLLPSLPYTADFETAEGYTTGSLNNQRGWSVTAGTAQITASGAFHGTQTVVLNSGTTAAQIDQEFGPSGTNPSPVFVDFYAKPVAGADVTTGTLFDLDAARIACVLNGSAGQLLALDGDGAGAGTWKPLANTLPLSTGNVATAWQRITVRLNLTAKTYDLYLNGAMIAADLKFRLSSAAYVSWFSVKGVTAASASLDDLYVGPTNPLFADVNNNGLDDAWETAHGLSLSSDNRAADSDGDGLTNLQEYIAGSDPQDPYNGNSLPDAWEVQYFGHAGVDPNADPDLDGLTNLQEYRLGRNPTKGTVNDTTSAVRLQLFQPRN
jgi:chitodextrinase